MTHLIDQAELLNSNVLTSDPDDDTVRTRLSETPMGNYTKSGGRKPNINAPSHLRRIAEEWLRDIPRSNRYFWCETYAQQLALAISDMGCTDQSRSLGLNESAVMGLNEITAQEGQGYFFWHKTRDGWHKPVKPPACPITRQPPRPGYAEMLVLRLSPVKPLTVRIETSSQRSLT
jgi:hypothetical protein